MLPDAQPSIDLPRALRRHGRALHSIARALVGDGSAADDVVADSVVEALQRPPRDHEAVGGWLATVVQNRARKWRREESRRQRREQSVARLDVEADARAVAERAEMLQRIVDGVHALAPLYRQVVWQRYFEGRTPTQIARDTDVPLATVKSRLRRGLSQLRADLDSDGGDWRAAVVVMFGVEGGIHPGVAAATGAGLMKIGFKSVVVVVAAVFFAAVLCLPALDVDAAIASPSAANDVSLAEGRGASPMPVTIGAAADVQRTAVAPAMLVGLVVDAETLEPIGGARIAAAPPATREPDAVRPMTASLEDGTFRAALSEGLPDEILVRAEGYVQAWVSVRARPGESDLVHLPEVRLRRGSMIRGRVVDESSSSPVEGAQIVFLPPGERSGLHPSAAGLLASSAADGTFEIACGIAPPLDAGGNVTLVAIAERGVGWCEFSVVDGRDWIDDVEVRLRRSCSMRVQVLRSGRPAAGVEVALQPSFAPWFPVVAALPPRGQMLALDPGAAAAFRNRFAGVTGNDGIVTFGGLPLAGTEEPRGNRYHVGGFVPDAPAVIAAAELSPFGHNDLQLEIRDAVDIAVSGTVVDPDRRPIAGARVEMPAVSLHAVTGEDGSWRIEAPSGELALGVVRCSAEGFAAENVDLTAPGRGGRRHGIEFMLWPGAPIRGRVVDTLDQPVTGVRLVLQQDEHFTAARSAVDGSFETADAQARAGKLAVFPDLASYQRIEGLAVPAHQRELLVRLEPVAKGQARLEAELFDAADGRQVDPGDVFITERNAQGETPELQPHRRIERRPGRILIDELSPGTYELWVQASGYGNVRRLFTIDEGQQSTSLRIGLGAAGALAGTVAWLHGPIPKDMRVDLELQIDGSPGFRYWGAGSRSRAQVEVLADGTFPCSSMTAGRWTARVSGQGVLSEPVSFEVAAGGTASCRLQAVLGGVLRLQSTATTVTGRAVLWLEQGGAWVYQRSRSCSPERPPVFEMTLPAGGVRWRITFPRSGELESDEPLAPEQTGEVRLREGEKSVVEFQAG
jgi:RNA polymerase sigma-70 factor (ECF subfamily)